MTNTQLFTEGILPVLISFAVSVLLSPLFIPFLKKLKFGQYVRDDGPKSHLKKSGTPTMGGLIILCSVVLTSLVFIKDHHEMVPVLFVTLGFGLIGFLDDYIKVVMKRSLGLRAWQKIVTQLLVTGIFCYYLLKSEHFGTDTIIPFYGTVTMPVYLFVPFL